MTLDEAIRARRSIRKYSEQPVSPETLEAVLEAGRLAPSGLNDQKWHFTVVRNAKLRHQLVEACHNQPFVGTAPIDLVVWAEEDRTMSCDRSAATTDCAIALTHMMLKAADLGLGTCWLGSFSAPAVHKLLNLPEGAVVTAVTPLGYPAEQPKPRPRKALSEIIDIRE